MGLANSTGCATEGDLATVQQEVRNGLAVVRGQEQKIAELRRELKSFEQGKVKDLHETEMRLTDTLRDVQQQLAAVTLSQARMKEALHQVETTAPTKERMEGMYREKARLEGILHAMHVTLVDGLRTEKAELTDRLHVLDKALKDLQQSDDNIQPPAHHMPEEQRSR
jgi:chromosome segregation ATPase